jgi:hypothetical protein
MRILFDPWQKEAYRRNGVSAYNSPLQFFACFAGSRLKPE